MMISAFPSEAVNKMAFSSLPDHSKDFSVLPVPTIHRGTGGLLASCASTGQAKNQTEPNKMDLRRSAHFFIWIITEVDWRNNRPLLEVIFCDGTPLPAAFSR